MGGAGGERILGETNTIVTTGNWGDTDIAGCQFYVSSFPHHILNKAFILTLTRTVGFFLETSHIFSLKLWTVITCQITGSNLLDEAWTGVKWCIFQLKFNFLRESHYQRAFVELEGLGIGKLMLGCGKNEAGSNNKLCACMNILVPCPVWRNHYYSYLNWYSCQPLYTPVWWGSWAQTM